MLGRRAGVLPLPVDFTAGFFGVVVVLLLGRVTVLVPVLFGLVGLRAGVLPLPLLTAGFAGLRAGVPPLPLLRLVRVEGARREAGIGMVFLG